ncbi:MAG: GTPase Era [Lachnospiraceae bacterium]|nr:GTPase Era [Lachnospiraceae bacterium]
MKSGYAALVGRPNVGKSTLMNRLIGQKIAITSDRPQTTRDKIETVYTDERGQIIFMDTPGIHKAKNKLGEYMDLVAEKTFSDADVILWLVEPTTYIGAGEEHIAEMLRAVDRKKHPVLLVINKTDTLDDPDEIENVIKAYREKCEYEEIICVSAVTGKNEEELLDTLFRYMPEGPLYYDEETVTEIPMRSIAEELIREQMLKHIKEEIPHGTAVQINRFKERKDGIFDIDADIVCERDSHKGIIIGRGGSMLKKIGTAARAEIEDQLGAQVNLKLFVKVRKNWRDDENLIRSYGYDLKKYR